VRRIAVSGLVALAAVLGGAAVPATALAQSAAPVRAGSAVAAPMARTAPPPAESPVGPGVPMISCVLTTDCLGIKGSSSEGGVGAPSTRTRVARWNGSSWKGVGVMLPTGTKSEDLNGVSCKGAKSCLVVGDYYTSTSDTATSRALALSYNGTSLRPTPAVPLPKGMPYAPLAGVSCVTTRLCVAVGTASPPPFGITVNDSATIIETWSGAKWTLHTIRTPASEAIQISGVSCATSAFCVITGTNSSVTSTNFGSKLYFASWNGRKLTAMKPTVVGSSADLVEPLGVSCATPTSCAVTGVNLGDVSSDSTTTSSGFTEIWNGTTWTLGKVTRPAGITASALVGVSCYAARSCEAVGVDEVDGVGGVNGASVNKSIQAAAASYHDTVGTAQTVPAPPKGNSSVFYSVSCLPWASCVAVGETGKATTSPGAVMTGVWNGKAWKLVPGF
jgi:hypothetical protein